MCSHGGHLTEMLEVEEAFKGHDVFYISYTGASTEDLKGVEILENMGASPINFLVGSVKIFFRILKEKPDVVFSTGAEIALPACYLGKLLGARIGYMECSAQVVTPSSTGRLVYPIADLFLVQWESLLKRYGKKARYVGGLI
ncbi:capsular biosynthesis protein [Candidatus Altiarchaeota archaeon]